MSCDCFKLKVGECLKLLKRNRNQWTIDDVNRFLDFLQLNSKMMSILINNYDIDGHKLFEIQALRNYLSQFYDRTNYLPLQKLFIIIEEIVYNNGKNYQNTQDCLHLLPSIHSQHILNIKKELKNLKNKNQYQILWLSNDQIVKLFAAACMPTESQLCKNCNADGFSLIYVLSRQNVIMNMRNYFSQNDIDTLKYLSQLLMIHYFQQIYTRPQCNDEVSSQQKNRSSIFDRFSRGSSEMCGLSEIYGFSEKNSVRGSAGFSIDFTSSYIGSESHNQKNQASNSSFESFSVLEDLKQKCLKLPLNLLDLKPLAHIRIQQIQYPFSKDLLKDGKATVCGKQGVEKEQSRTFNMEGVKFGRGKNNSFSCPDEGSISSKHAQIVFKNDAYYLKDLSSKTGTFLYIAPNRPLTLSDQTCIQFSHEIQAMIRINKKDSNQGNIKITFTKPDNYPQYKDIIKNNQVFTIGRASNSHIKLNNPILAPHHASIKYQNQKFLLSDCGTSTGTWLRLSPKSVKSTEFLIETGSIFRLSSKKVFMVLDINTISQGEKYNTLEVIKHSEQVSDTIQNEQLVENYMAQTL